MNLPIKAKCPAGVEFVLDMSTAGEHLSWFVTDQDHVKGGNMSKMWRRSMWSAHEWSAHCWGCGGVLKDEQQSPIKLRIK